MKAVSQSIVCLASLVSIFLLGVLFDTAYWQASYHARKLLDGKPLPRVTQFFIENHHLPFYLALLPWLWLVGAPLLTLSATRSYWDASAFVLRYLTFLSCEWLFFFILLLFLFLPYIPYYWILQSSDESTLELAVRLGFWGCVAIITLAGFHRVRQIYRNRNT